MLVVKIKKGGVKSMRGDGDGALFCHAELLPESPRLPSFLLPRRLPQFVRELRTWLVAWKMCASVAETQEARKWQALSRGTEAWRAEVSRRAASLFGLKYEV
ncbi:hypothetical protein ACLB2K_029110 [Fragaria x ananassa]